jgi:hypothetical protein
MLRAFRSAAKISQQSSRFFSKSNHFANKSYDLATKAKEQLADKFIDDPNIVSVGTQIDKNGIGFVSVGLINSKASQIPSEYVVDLDGKKHPISIRTEETGEILAHNMQL